MKSWQPTGARARIAACVSYGTVSVLITLFNKAVFQFYKFNYPNFVTTLQIVLSIVYMSLLRSAGVLKYEDVQLSKCKKLLPLAFFWWLYVVSGVTALRYLNVPMYSVFRKSTTLMVVLGEWRLFRKIPSGMSLVSLLAMVSGAMIAGLSDLTFSLPGYIFVSICAVSTAVYLLLIRKLQEKTGLSQSSLLMYNNFLSLPIMLVYMILFTNELNEIPSYPQLFNLKFQMFLLISMSQAFLLNVCIFWCTTVNSPLATSVTGQMKDILTTSFGMFMFGDMKYHPWNIFGIVVGLLGSTAYSVISYREVKQQKLQQKKAREDEEHGKV